MIGPRLVGPTETPSGSRHRLEVGQSRGAKLVLIAVWASWVPSVGFSYLVPWLVVLVALLGPAGPRSLRRLLAVLCVGVVFTVPHVMLERSFSLQGAWLALLTYGSWIAAIVVAPLLKARERDLVRLAERISWLVLLQGVLGVAEAIVGFMHTGSFDVSNGDWVKGTLGFTASGYLPGTNFGNAAFAANMFVLVIFVALLARTRVSRVAVFVGGTSLILASVVHVLVFGVVSLAWGLVLLIPLVTKWSSLRVVGIVLGGALFALVTFAFLPSNTSQLFTFGKDLNPTLNPRIAVVKRLGFVSRHGYADMWLAGVGPGQFSSRAALISTGHYFGGFYSPRRLPVLKPITTRLQRIALMDLWAWAARTPYFGSTEQPYFSWMSFAVEFGLVVSALALLWIALRTRYILARVRLRRVRLPVAFAAIVIATFILLLGGQENYWEIPQAILPGAILIPLLFMSRS